MRKKLFSTWKMAALDYARSKACPLIRERHRKKCYLGIAPFNYNFRTTREFFSYGWCPHATFIPQTLYSASLWSSINSYNQWLPFLCNFFGVIRRLHNSHFTNTRLGLSWGAIHIVRTGSGGGGACGSRTLGVREGGSKWPVRNLYVLCYWPLIRRVWGEHALRNREACVSQMSEIADFWEHILKLC